MGPRKHGYTYGDTLYSQDMHSDPRAIRERISACSRLGKVLVDTFINDITGSEIAVIASPGLARNLPRDSRRLDFA